MSEGTWHAVGAYIIWGLLPVYWKWLHHVPAPQLLAHRVIWSLLFLLVTIRFLHRWERFRAAILNRRVIGIYALAAGLLGFNWLTYVWAVNTGFIVEASLGYFINPLLNVAMGIFLFREQLRRWQWIALALAAAGVLYLTFVYGSLPWIAFALALSFSLYSLVKKAAPLGSLYSLTLETAILFLPALAFLLFSEVKDQGVFLHAGVGSDLLLIGGGLMTIVPMLMFVSAARQIPLSLIGVLQYIAPTLQFLLGVLVYNEPFSRARLIGFAIVWAALIVFTVDGLLAHRSRQRQQSGRTR